MASANPTILRFSTNATVESGTCNTVPMHAQLTSMPRHTARAEAQRDDRRERDRYGLPEGKIREPKCEFDGGINVGAGPERFRQQIILLKTGDGRVQIEQCEQRNVTRKEPMKSRPGHAVAHVARKNRAARSDGVGGRSRLRHRRDLRRPDRPRRAPAPVADATPGPPERGAVQRGPPPTGPAARSGKTSATPSRDGFAPCLSRSTRYAFAHPMVAAARRNLQWCRNPRISRRYSAWATVGSVAVARACFHAENETRTCSGLIARQRLSADDTARAKTPLFWVTPRGEIAGPTVGPSLHFLPQKAALGAAE